MSFGKWIGLGILVFWAASMIWLTVHDVLPTLGESDPPQPPGVDWVEKFGDRLQVSMYDRHKRWVGGCWTSYLPAGRSLTRTDEIFLADLGPIGPIKIDTRLNYDEAGALDEFQLKVLGAPIKIEANGERMGPHFPIVIDAGPAHYNFKLAHAEASLLGDAFRPFVALPHLEVGKHWRISVLNPAALLVGRGQKMISTLVSVTGQEEIDHGGRPVQCFIVEMKGMKAWVDNDGRVLRQQAELPIVGQVTLVDEPYDTQAREEARAAMRQH